MSWITGQRYKLQLISNYIKLPELQQNSRSIGLRETKGNKLPGSSNLGKE